MRPAPVLLLVVALLAGCVQTTPDAALAPATTDQDDLPEKFPVRCRLLQEDRAPLTVGTCRFSFEGQGVDRPVAPNGTADQSVTAGATGIVQGSAPGRVSKSVTLTVDAAKAVDLILEAAPEGAVPVGEGPSETSAPVAAAAPTSPVRRSWGSPIQVPASGTEPHVAVDAEGIVYYAPTNTLWRSVDGGHSWEDISPGLSEALPVLAGDTSLSIAPDGTLWWSRYWGYAGGTIGCTSTTRGNSWTCDNLAIPGVTDRMWIVGLDDKRGYLQTNQGLYHHEWAYTDTGSLKYMPYATTTTPFAVRNGNMVYDEVNDRVWQIESVGKRLQLIRVDGGPGLVTTRALDIPAPYALPWIAVQKGVLWTTGEPQGTDGSRTVVAARSFDGGANWQMLPVPITPRSATFSYVAAGPDGRVAVVYYGSDAPGASTANGGTWSLYVAETSNGLDLYPTWVETRLVPHIHTGNVCIGLNCEDAGDDPDARFSGDLMGAWIDGQGNVHVAYVDGTERGKSRLMYVRQTRG